ncbi:NERD domain-containing protein [Nocardia sp. NPDC058705]|uniref:NERD domain-containing protein n=1 Tax=Nocardia sp. NPDC058705 TaxID=3346609 RepID=UPI0036C2E88D
MIVVVADESDLEGAEQIVGEAVRDQAFQAGGIVVFRCHVPESRGGSVEVDALVCTPQSVTIVEVKGFTARQEGTLATPPNGPWTIDGEPAALYHAARVPNPFVQVRRQVFAAKSLLQQTGIFGWVNAVIALVPQPGAEITIEETRIADGYRAVLVDRDDASALHDYFQAESGRTVRLSVEDVTRVFAALNLDHQLPSSNELMAQGFPAALDPATTSRPAAPTAIDPSATSVSGSGAGGSGAAPSSGASGSSSRVGQAATPAFLAAIDRLAHRSPAAVATSSTGPDESRESPTPSEESSREHTTTSASIPASLTTAGSAQETTEPSVAEYDSPIMQPSTGPDEPAPDEEGPGGSERQEPSPDDRSGDEPVGAASSLPTAADDIADESAAHQDDGADHSPSTVVRATSPEEGLDPPLRSEPENAVSLSKSPDRPGPPPIDDSRIDDDEPATSADSTEHHHESSPEESAAPAKGSGAAVGVGTAIGVGTAVAAARSASESSGTAPRVSATPVSAPAYHSSEQQVPQQNSEHWTDWVERDRTTRPTLLQRWRAKGSALRNGWHNRPVQERRAPRRGIRVGPGVGLLLFIALFGAGFFAITAVQASQFEMSDYDRMCGEDKKPFPNAAPYDRDGASPIYLSGHLTTMVNPGDPTAWNPSDPSTVQLIACMKQLELRDLVQTCQYGPGPGAPIGRTVNLFRATYEIAVYELHTGREVAKATMLGERYSDNPSNTDPDRCRAAADAPDYLGRRLGQPSTAQLTGFLAPLVHADRTTP